MFFYSKEEFIEFILNLIAKNKTNKKVTQIFIQKTIYIVYSYFLLFDKKIANINFETWKWGPVIYELWKKQTVYKDKNIPLIFDQNEYSKYLESNSKEINLIEKIIIFLLNLESWDIVQICHEQTPWKNLYTPNRNSLIKDKDIIKFHNENENNFFHYLNFVLK